MDISPIMRQVARRYGLPPKLDGPQWARRDPCDFCGSKEAVLLAKMDYWDLSEHNLLECQNCGLMQIDPMLTDENLAIGCKAFYRFEKQSHGLKELRRTCLRNFRKGVSFAIELQRLGVEPKRSLELGAGDAYFSRGMKFVFPNLDVWVLDVVPEILDVVKKHHGFQIIAESAETMSPEKYGPFDLIVGRDILEHVRMPQAVLKKIHVLLKQGGIFHFITPNGYEDVWFTYGYYRLHRRPTELLINHVSYFPTETLKSKLQEIGFELKRWILFDFKGTFREGKGKIIDPNQLSAPSTKRSATGTINNRADNPIDFSSVNPEQILSQKWLKHPGIAKLYCHMRHGPKWYCSGEVGIGHEIYGLAVKR